MASWLADTIPSRSISFWLTTPVAQSKFSVIKSKACWRLAGVKSFESLMIFLNALGIFGLGLLIKIAPATIGPAQAPLPASSKPATLPYLLRSFDSW
jgi:hypothetical protein